MPSGYSGTPLAQKLGIKPGTRLVVQGAPWDYARVVMPPAGVTIGTRLSAGTPFIHAFFSAASKLEANMPKFAAALADEGRLWISWPKRTSGVATDLTEEIIRQAGLAAGVVDVKVCAVDEVWSGLAFVRRLRDRKAGSR